MEPAWVRVTSSDIDAVAYDSIGKRLRIRFRSGAIYEYDGVPPVVYDEFLTARSKGGYFSEYVRPEYPYRRVRGAVEGVPAQAR